MLEDGILEMTENDKKMIDTLVKNFYKDGMKA